MKKLVGLFLLVTAVLTLTACAKIPEGVDQKFHNKATSIFTELDDDTMEMELSDGDDLANYQLIAATATSEREVAFAESLGAMLKLQDKVIGNVAAGIAPDGKSLQEYMKARHAAMEAMNFGDVGDMDDFEVPTFEFTEETD
jgi:hypothetical protein